MAKTHNPGGVHAHYRAVRRFLGFLVEQEELDRSPMEKIKPPKLDLEPLEPVSMDTLQAMLETCASKSEIDLRDKSLLLTLLDTGMRAGEACALNIADIDLNGGTIQVRKSKSRKPRVVFAGRQARRLLAAYLRTRNDVRPTDPLWITCPLEQTGGQPGRLTYWGLRQIIRRRADKAKVPVPSLHSFRRAFAILSLRNGADPVSISRMLGHGSLPVVMRYLKQLSQDLGQVHQTTSPVDRQRW